MTRQQTHWARGHKWFASAVMHQDRSWSVNVFVGRTDKTISFDDFEALQRWAEEHKRPN